MARPRVRRPVDPAADLPGDPNTSRSTYHLVRFLGDQLDLAATGLSGRGRMLNISPVRLSTRSWSPGSAATADPWHQKEESQLQVWTQIAMVITLAISPYFAPASTGNTSHHFRNTVATFME